MLVVDENDVVKRALKMQGATLFARLKRHRTRGMGHDGLRDAELEEPYDKNPMQAIRLVG